MMVEDIAAFVDVEMDWAILPSTMSTGQTANLFKYDMPDSPNFCVALYQYGGQGPRETFGNTKLIRLPRLQVVVRDLRISTAFDRAEEIWLLLSGVKEQDINGTRYHKIKPVTEPFELGPDAQNRERVVCDYEIWKKG